MKLGSLSTHAAFLRLQKRLEHGCLLLEGAFDSPPDQQKCPGER